MDHKFHPFPCPAAVHGHRQGDRYGCGGALPERHGPDQLSGRSDGLPGGLLLLDVKFALFLGGFLNGLTNFIPIIGLYRGGIPAVIVAFISSPAQAIKVTLLILIIQQVEGNLIAPLIFSHSLKFHPPSWLSCCYWRPGNYLVLPACCLPSPPLPQFCGLSPNIF